MIQLDDRVVAVCECGAYRQTTTFRKLRKKWPTCRPCGYPLKVPNEQKLDTESGIDITSIVRTG